MARIENLLTAKQVVKRSLVTPKRTKLTPSVLSQGSGTGQRGSELAQLSVSFVRLYSRIFRENLRVL